MIVALIQARTSSSRFPGKVLEPIGDIPMIVYQLRRVLRAQRIDRAVVVTSTDPSDDPLARALADFDVPCFRGPLDDVLERYRLAAEAHGAETVIRLTGDCPLIDPGLIDQVVDLWSESGADYASNIDPPLFPDGVDVEVFSAAALARAAAEARQTSEREHVTLWMRNDANGLVRRSLPAIVDSSALRLTVDYPDDLEVVRAIVSAMDRDTFDLFDILRFLQANPWILQRNPHARNEGLAISLATEAKDAS